MIDKTKFRMPEYNEQNLFQFYERMGQCLYQIQCFENAIEHYLVHVHQTDMTMEREEIERIYKIHDKFTIGHLFKEVMKCEKLPNELENRITNFIGERNWLVHHCRKENKDDLFNENKFPLLLERLDNLSDESLALAKLFLNKSEEYTIAQGIATREQLDIETQKILDSLGKA
jgi:hypothetical protein